MNIQNQQVRHWLEQVAFETSAEFDLIEDDDVFSTDLAYNRYAQGMTYLRSENYADAENMFWDSIATYKMNDDDWDMSAGMIYAPYLGLSYCYKYTNRIGKAIKVLNMAVEAMLNIREENNGDCYWSKILELYISIGRLYVEVGNREMALHYHERAVEYLNN